MSNLPLTSSRRRLLVLLLSLVLAVRVSGLGLHSLGHQPGVGLLDIPVFDAAKHAEDGAHLEAGEVLVYVGCPACLLFHSSDDLPWLPVAPSSIPRAQSSAVASTAEWGECHASQFDPRAPPIA